MSDAPVLKAGNLLSSMYFLRGYGHAACFTAMEPGHAHREDYRAGYEFGCAQRLAAVAAAEAQP